MPKKTSFDYIFDFVGALTEISNDVYIHEYYKILKALYTPIEDSRFTPEDVEKLTKHNKQTKKKYVKIFRGLYEEEYEALFNEQHDWIIQQVNVPSTRSDLCLPLSQVYKESSLDSKLAILKYIYLISISIEEDAKIKDALKDIYKRLDEDNIRHHETSSGSNDEPISDNPLADMIQHMTKNMPMPEDPSKPDFGQMFGYVTSMFGDERMQKNIGALTKQLEKDGMQSFFQNMQSTFEKEMPTQPDTGTSSSSITNTCTKQETPPPVKELHPPVKELHPPEKEVKKD